MESERARRDMALRQDSDKDPRPRPREAARGRTIRWNLLQVMISRNIRYSVALRNRLEEVGVSLSAQHVSRLVSKMPDRLSTRILTGICNALDCEPGDLLKMSGHRTAKDRPGAD